MVLGAIPKLFFWAEHKPEILIWRIKGFNTYYRHYRNNVDLFILYIVHVLRQNITVSMCHYKFGDTPVMTKETSSIISICDELLKNGERPSAAKVREIRGSGSNSTIQPGIDKWWDTLISRINYFSAHPNLDESVVAAAAKMQKAAHKAAKEEYVASESEYLKRISALEEENIHLHGELKENLQKVESQAIAVDSAKAEILSLRDERADYKNQVKLLAAGNVAKSELIEEVRSQNIEKTKVIDEAKAEARALSNEKFELENEVIRLKKEMAKARSLHEVESHEFSLVISQRNNTQIELEEEVSITRTNVKQLEEEITNRKIKENNLCKKVQQLTDQYLEEKNKHEIFIAQTNPVIKRIKGMESQIKDLLDDKTFLKSELTKERVIYQDMKEILRREKE